MHPFSQVARHEFRRGSYGPGHKRGATRGCGGFIRTANGNIELGNLIDGCPCPGFRYRQNCKHYRAAATAYDATQRNAAIIGTIDEGGDDYDKF